MHIQIWTFYMTDLIKFAILLLIAFLKNNNFITYNSHIIKLDLLKCTIQWL
jgi:hypothetical protein